MLVTFLSNPHFVDGMDERDYKLSLLQANNASLSCVKKHPLLCLLGNIVLNIFVIVLVMLISV